MLTHIYVKNFVLIDQVALDFSDGMSVFTGETGAGKSLLIDAISLLCGERASAGYVKKGCAKAVIEGVSTSTMMRVPMRSCENRDLIWTGKI